MGNWSTHHFFIEASKELNPALVLDMQKYATFLNSKNFPIIFSLGHLSRITGVDYKILHDTVNRKREVANYNLFAITKRSGGRRFIHAVNGKLFRLHKFINEEILQNEAPHPSSFAFHSSGGIRQCAEMHCGAKWILQFDLKDFFYTISEQQVYQCFKDLGYKRLLSFELARLCTTLHLPKLKRKYCNDINSIYFDKFKIGEIPYKRQTHFGVLPQGAPTSPMLSNLIARKLDISLFEYAQENGFIYTRYADDLTFSTSSLPNKKSIGCIQKEIVSIIRRCRFIENKKKMRIAGPGSKKIVLGLLVDGIKPRISKQTYKRIDRNIYAALKFGLEKTAEHENFDSAYGFYNHLSGLLSFVKDVDKDRWYKFNEKFTKIVLPFGE